MGAGAAAEVHRAGNGAPRDMLPRVYGWLERLSGGCGAKAMSPQIFAVASSSSPTSGQCDELIVGRTG
jgi:hypothetical protein